MLDLGTPELEIGFITAKRFEGGHHGAPISFQEKALKRVCIRKTAQ